MQTLTVLYDANCRLCSRIRLWLESQPKFIDLDFIAAGSADAAARYPMFDHSASLKELFVVTEGGSYYRGAKAWLMCLWALREYRDWSLRFSSPEMMPFARRFVVKVSSLRFRFGYRAGS